MRLNDTFCGLLVLLVGVAVVVYARTFQVTSGQSIGPGFFPTLVGIGLILCGATLGWSGRRNAGTGRVVFEDWVGRPRMVVNGALVIGALIFYALAVDQVGFFITAFLFLAVLFVAFGVQRRWIVATAVVVTIGLHFAFYTLLRVPLPWGWLEAIAW